MAEFCDILLAVGQLWYGTEANGDDCGSDDFGQTDASGKDSKGLPGTRVSGNGGKTKRMALGRM